ncbi:MCH protein, partial [Eudromia elegans]|nr:MCH protein [Eudromia elegans]
MCLSSYVLILSLSLFSQGFLISVSKSLQKVEDEDMLLNAFSLGRTLRNGDRTENRGATTLLKNFKTQDSRFFGKGEDRNPTFFDMGSKHDFLNQGMVINLGSKWLPYLALKGVMAFPADTEIQKYREESVQGRRDTGDEEKSAKLPIGRRDFDVLRCMLGRVYRPCWQI